MKCYKCHNIIDNEARFCKYCGCEQGFSNELIQKAMEGDDFSQQELYKRTYNNVYMVVSSLVKDEDISHDLVQDTYIKAYSKLDQLQDPNKFRPWIKRISHNMAIDYLRKNKDIVFSDLEKDADIVYDIEDESKENIPDVSLGKDETARILNEVLNNLPDSQRVVLVMFYYEDYSIKEIASELGISENTVKSRLKYGRDNLEKTIITLEKEHDFKLRGITPIPLLYLLFRNGDALEIYEPNTSLVLTKQTTTQEVKEAAVNQDVMPEVTSKSKMKEPMSSMMKKVIGGVVCVGLVGGGAGLYFSSQNKPKPVKPEEKPLVQKEEKLSSEEVYMPVIEEYQEALMATELKDDYAYTSSGFISYFKSRKDFEGLSYNLYYAYYDIDHNGQDELLIGSGVKHPVIDSVYGRDKNQVKSIVQDGLNDKGKITIYPDGTIVVISRYDATTQYGTVYKLDEDGFTLKEEFKEDLVNGKTNAEFLDEQADGQLEVGLHDKTREEDETPLDWKLIEPMRKIKSVDAFIGHYANGNGVNAGNLIISREGNNDAYVRLFNSDYREIVGGKATLTKKGTLMLDGVEFSKKSDYELEIKTAKKLDISNETFTGGINEAEVDYQAYDHFKGENGEVLTIEDEQYILKMNGKEYFFDIETADAWTPNMITFYTLFVDGKRNNDYPYVQFFFEDDHVSISMGSEKIVLRG